MIRYDDKVISVLSAWTLLSECTKKYTQENEKFYDSRKYS